MKAFVLTAEGPALAEVERPRPGAAEALVRVAACGLNRVDLAMSRGHVHGGAGGVGRVLGVEWAGEVVEVGAEVQGLAPGDRVMCSGAGGFAEYALVEPARALPVPSPDLPWEAAATLSIALLTMHDAVVTHGAVAPGQAALVQGASSGVGLMALQIARLKGAGFVAGSSTDPDRRGRLAAFGADLAFDPRDPGWVEAVLAATEGRGVDLTIDQVSGAGLPDLFRATRVGGRVVNVGRLGGERAEFDYDLHALRRLTYVGVTFRTRSRAEVAEISRRLRQDLWPDLAAGRLALPIDRVFPFEALPEALAHMAANRHFGKVAVQL